MKIERKLRPTPLEFFRICVPVCSSVILAVLLFPQGDPTAALRAQQETFRSLREEMVRTQIAASRWTGPDAVRDPRVLEAMRQVPRHLFVPPEMVPHAYEDRPLPIGYGQTISQPYIVAKMTELAEPKETDRALEIGTGSGYQAAVLSRLVAEVHTIEIVEPLGVAARQRLRALGYKNVEVRVGDGYQGWPEKAPFDIILVTAAPEQLPPKLVEELRPGGRMVLPVGPNFQTQSLKIVTKNDRGEIRTREVMPVVFVPMVPGKRN